MTVTSQTTQDVLPAQRRAKILDMVRQRGAASIQELSQDINVSAATIRRDLNYLSDQNYIERTHGGAVMVQLSAFEPAHDISAASAKAQKQAIGQLAATRLKRGQSVIFDFSSTVLEAAKVVAQQNLAIQAVTNDLTIASVLATAPQVKLIVPGGSLRPNSYTLLGEPGLSFLQRLNADVALLGIHALADDYLSDSSVEVTSSKQAVVDAAHTRILLADASKIDSRAFCKVCPLSAVEEVITDDSAPQAWCDRVRELGVQVTQTYPQTFSEVAL